ncbi:MAG: altronate dehydratase family protein [Bacteroidetes bacterium]|nr:altronate dehydratase family protein [Bacteroidota bacterium]
MKALQIHPTDTVAVALDSLHRGDTLTVQTHTVTLRDDVPQGHKFSLVYLPKGSPVIKYGYTIGVATEDILPGVWVHTHNIHTGLSGTLEYSYYPKTLHHSTRNGTIPTFHGYKRANGTVGIRNEIWILPTVGCVNKTAEQIARETTKKLHGETFDGVWAFPHPFGCSQLGEDLESTKRILRALAQNPNAGGVLFIGLGCENNTLETMLGELPGRELLRYRFFSTQQVSDEIEVGVQLVRELITEIEKDKREEVPVSKLVLGMKCGGSDGFSGITGNALVGRIADIHTSYGGTVLLTEVPEMFGAEQELMNRATSTEVFEAIVKLINTFKRYYITHNHPVYENPSPGNKAGGITTLEEKSLGAIQKGGNAPVVGVLDYGETLSPTPEPGVFLLNAPGNDGVSTTALTGAGATIVLFTTGRGTPLGAPVPTVKIATNTGLARTKPQWIDFDAGQIITDERAIDEVAQELYSFILKVASGELKVKNELNNFKEIAIWKKGVTL